MCNYIILITSLDRRNPPPPSFSKNMHKTPFAGERARGFDVTFSVLRHRWGGYSRGVFSFANELPPSSTLISSRE